ncbi:hypothetical protein P691DRAFT_777665 [Macrolepiota fuliginosa MF-IS2]|uniref:DUF6593 domain-containing protein n=1 Tax=Macrolepiota fuliginosa MF-IS2 TaxID=1400762 RepID=A0A9P5X8Z0_9AGAR|nr:hypothetical protein P691DRAFT_777665 [Macrolepiota fuliginosa MF-IS2]
MILNFSERSVSDTVLLTDSGQPLYHVSTSTFGFKTKIKKSGQSTQGFVTMASVEHQVFGSVVTLWGKCIDLAGENFFSMSRTFTASDRCRYKWKVEAAEPMILVTHERAGRAVVATFDRGSYGIFSKSRPMSLSVSDEYRHLLDDIVVTCIFMEQERKRKRRNRNNSSANAAAIM